MRKKEAGEEMSNVLTNSIVYKGISYLLPVTLTLFLPYFLCYFTTLPLVPSDCNSDCELFLTVQLLVCLDDAWQGDHSLKLGTENLQHKKYRYQATS